MNVDGAVPASPASGGPVTLHLWRVPTRAIARAAGRMALDPPALRVTPGLRFAKLLGTSAGRTFAITEADPHRWGLFAAWDSSEALAAFEVGEVARRWSDIAEERWRATLQPLRWRGQWSGRDPFAGMTGAETWDGPVAVLTRARIRLRKTMTFWQAVPAVAEALHADAGACFACGVGELPVGVQGTFSVWPSAHAMTSFAYASAAHRRAIDRTSSERWYAEELFARFAVVGSDGTVGGRNPIALVSAAT